MALDEDDLMASDALVSSTKASPKLFDISNNIRLNAGKIRHLLKIVE